MKETTDTFKDFCNLWSDMTMTMMKKPMECAAQACSAEHYEKLYAQFSKHMSEMMEQTMRSPGFAAKSWEAFKGTRAFQKVMSTMMEQSLKNLSIPTHKDINFMSERMNALEDRIVELEAQLKAASAPPPREAEEKAEKAPKSSPRPKKGK